MARCGPLVLAGLCLVFVGCLPSASNLNFKAGQTVPNLVMVPCQDGFGMSLYNDSTGTTDLIVDVYGYFS